VAGTDGLEWSRALEREEDEEEGRDAGTRREGEGI